MYCSKRSWWYPDEWQEHVLWCPISEAHVSVSFIHDVSQEGSNRHFVHGNHLTWDCIHIKIFPVIDFIWRWKLLSTGTSTYCVFTRVLLEFITTPKTKGYTCWCWQGTQFPAVYSLIANYCKLLFCRIRTYCRLLKNLESLSTNTGL